MDRRQIHLRLSITMALMILAMGIVGWISVVNEQRATRLLDKSFNDEYVPTKLVAEANAQLLAWNRAVINFVVSHSRSDRQRFAYLADLHAKAGSDTIQKLISVHHLRPEGTKLISDIEAGFARATNMGERIIRLGGTSRNRTAAIGLLRQKLRPLVDKIDLLMSDFIVLQEKQFDSAISQVRERSQERSTAIVIVMVMAIVVGTATSYLVGSYLSKKIEVAMKEKKVAESKVARLSSQLIHSQEEERRRVAQDLHDGVGQTLSAAAINLNTYRKDMQRFPERFEIGLNFLNQGNKEMREVYTGLYPTMLADLGFKDTIEWYVENYLEPTTIRATIEIDIADELGEKVEIHFYRIIQELVSNTVKYSGGSHLTVSAGVNKDCAFLVYTDNGRGFSLEEVESEVTGFGIANIKQRVSDLNGNANLKVEPGEGMSLRIEVPVRSEVMA